jgi:dephospho-CoA kinase
VKNENPSSRSDGSSHPKGSSGIPFSNLLLVGLTGSIGSGKSLVADMFKELGASIIDADELARAVVAPGTEGLELVKKHFGPKILTDNGELCRKALGEIVFSAPEERKALEAILHPRIRELFRNRLHAEHQRATPPPMIIYAVPLLFESGYSYEELDKIIVVAAPREQCLARVVARDGSSREFAEKQLAAQLPTEAKVARADYVIRNDSSLENTRVQVQELFETLKLGSKKACVRPPGGVS